MVKTLVTLVFLSAHIIYCYGQDPQFSQFYAAQLFLNPAFTGNTKQFRLAGNYRNQWPQVPGAFISYTFAYDQHIESISSGIGFLLVRDKAGSAGLRFTNVGGLYAFKFKLKRELQMNLGVRASYTFRGLDYGNLHFGDQYLRSDGVTTESPVNSSVSYPDFSFGFVVYSTKYWIGGTIDHLTSPNQSLTGTNTPLPMKFSFHAGYEIFLKKDIKGDSRKSMIAALHYKKQQRWDQIDAVIYLKYNPIIFGVWYRGIPLLKAYQPGYMNNDALIGMVGIQVKDVFHIGYSYDFTISQLTFRSGGAHEVAIVYEFAQPEYKRENKRKRFIVPCAKF